MYTLKLEYYYRMKSDHRHMRKMKIDTSKSIILGSPNLVAANLQSLPNQPGLHISQLLLRSAPSMQVHSPVVVLQAPLPKHGFVPPPGHSSVHELP